jgi:hypothetical protein
MSLDKILWILLGGAALVLILGLLVVLIDTMRTLG